MNLEDFRIALLVAQAGSFARAARQMDTDPSRISRAIAKLEQSLGFRLFHRSTRRLSTTESGQAYLERVAAAIEEMENAANDGSRMNTTPSGTLRLSASIAFAHAIILPILPEFRSRYPDIAIELELSDANLDLVANRIDLAIRLAPAVSGDLIASRLMSTGYRVCASPRYLAQGRPLKRPSDLVSHPCLRLLLPEHRDLWHFRKRGGAVFSVAVGGDLLVSNPLILKQAAIAGIGPALLADWLVRDSLAEGALVELFPAFEVTATSFDTSAWILLPSRRFVPAKVRSMVEFLREKVVASAA